VGDFSQRIVETVTPTELHLIDPWEHQSSAEYKQAWYGGEAHGGQDEMNKRYAHVCKRFEEQILDKRVKVHRGLSNEILSQFPNEFFDWVYIDGNHLYEFVKADLELCFDKTKAEGFITGDDYIDGGWWKGGVKKAVDEFSRKPGIQLVEIRHRQFVLRKVT